MRPRWKLRYFRLEGDELCYYEKEPSARLAVEAVTTTRERGTTMAALEAKAAEQGKELTEDERAKAFMADQPAEIFTDKNLKGRGTVGGNYLDL